MKGIKTYIKDEVVNLENAISSADLGIPKGDDNMPKRIKEKVTVNGQVKWIDGYSMQNLMDNYVRLLEREGLIEIVPEDDAIPLFGDYLKLFYATFKQKQQSNTVINRERIARNHVLPKFGGKRIDRIQTMELQRWFNELGRTYSKETILKIKNIMNPVFESAVEDELITRNPLASRRLEITGKETVHHKAIPKNIMNKIKMEVKELPWKEKVMCGLLCYTAMRFEEVLGIRWEDISDEWITIRRAVVHPNRNMPEVKCPKTKTSERRIPLNPALRELLSEKQYKRGYLLYTDKDPNRETPLSYTEARRVFDKIRKRFDISDYTAHDFRDTCATEWRENGMSLDMVARLLGHSKTETTEKRYVKYRTELMEEAARLM